jgi:hypothetical protein
MKRIRADRLGSLCARRSVDPGSRGARRARVGTPSQASYRAYRLFIGAHQMSGAGLPVGPALLFAARRKGPSWPFVLQPFC